MMNSFEEDRFYSDSFPAILSTIGCSDFGGLMSHILKCMGLFLKMRRYSKGYRISSAEAKVFLISLIAMCDEGLATSERAVFETTSLSAAVDLATHVFRYSNGDQQPSMATNAAEVLDEKCSSSSVWQPLYWAVINPQWKAATELQPLINMIEQSAKEATDDTSASSSALLELTKETLLHYAAKATHDNTEALRLLSRQAPRAAFTQDVDGNLPLHAAAQYTESVENLQCLLQLNPKAICSQNKRGRTPIHVLAARINRSQLPLLECLLAVADPEDLMIQDKKGNTPLHLAWYEWSMKDAIVTRLIFDANPKAALVANSGNELPIHCIIHTFFWGPKAASSSNEIESLVETMISYFNTTSSPDDDDYPLLKVDNSGWTPLHVSCLNHQSLNLVPAVLRACPRATTIVDREGLLPLHLYIENFLENFKERVNIGTFRDLLCANALAASVENRWYRDGYPLHWIAEYGSLELVIMLYDAYPDAVRSLCTARFESSNANAFNYGSCAPLHRAVKNLCPIEGPKIIRFLYEKYPEAALLLPDNPASVHTPLHFAHYATMECLKTLCELAPAALKQQDQREMTPINRFVCYMAAAESVGCETVSQKSLLFLLKCSPDAAAIPSDENMVPYQYAKAKGASTYIQRKLLQAAPEVDPAAFRDLNYAARRGAMYLLHKAVPGNAKDMLLWLKLRESADAARAVILYL